MPFGSGGHGGSITVQVVDGGNSANGGGATPNAGGTTNGTATTGAANAPVLLQCTTGPTAISGNMIVRRTGGLLYVADPSDPWPEPYCIVGMTTGASLPGATATVVTYGPCPGASGLSADMPVFLGSKGNSTYTVPATGYLVRIGTVQDANTFFIDLGEPILRA